MCTSDEELPFFPSYESLLINDDNLRVVWFEPAFSQSHYNTGRTTNGSNACTIIAILVAAKVHFNGTRVKKSGWCFCSPRWFVDFRYMDRINLIQKWFTYWDSVWWQVIRCMKRWNRKVLSIILIWRCRKRLNMREKTLVLSPNGYVIVFDGKTELEKVFFV